MNKNKILLPILLFLFLAKLSPAAVSPIKEDFAKFDKHFIATLFYTAQEKTNKAKSEINLLLEFWKDFKTNYYSYAKNDKQWKKDFDKAENILKEAKGIINGGKNLKEAHEKLEKIREIFYNLRKRNNIDYYPDGLIKFHSEMEKIVHPLANKKPSEINDELIAKLKAAVKKAKADWAEFSEKKFDAETFSFPPQKTKKLMKAIEKEGKILKKFEMSLNGNNNGEIIKRGLKIKKGFRRVFLLFSNVSK